MNLLCNLIGVEAGAAEVARAIRTLAQSLAVPVVGAYHVTCSDETEWYVADVFHKVFVEGLLPPLRPEGPAAFRTMNLGARYEPGALAIAEHHYAVAPAADRAKLLVVKLNSHVAVRSTPEGPCYGTLARYGVESACCGALAAMLADGTVPPAVYKLRSTFQSDGIDRVAMLRDEQRIRPEHRALLAAVTNAWLQADLAVVEAIQRMPHSPTVFLVVPCVTINRAEEDTELVVGYWAVDATGDRPAIHYHGLGGVPAAYRLDHDAAGLVLQDDQWPIVLDEAEGRGGTP